MEMGDKVKTQSVTVDFSALAGKTKLNDVKASSKAKSNELSVEEKYNAHTLKKSDRKCEGTGSNKNQKERNVFQDIGSGIENKEGLKSNMATRDTIDEEIIFQREIQKKYIGNLHDNQTGSMMPVYMQYEVDGTKSKISGRQVSHTPSMGG